MKHGFDLHLLHRGQATRQKFQATGGLGYVLSFFNVGPHHQHSARCHCMAPPGNHAAVGCANKQHVNPSMYVDGEAEDQRNEGEDDDEDG